MSEPQAAREAAIDRFLPDHHFASQHQIEIAAGTGVVWRSLRRIDLSGSFGIRWLFRLRGLPGSGLTLERLVDAGFTVLASDPECELVLGLVARPWTLSGSIRRLDPEGFRSFDEPAYAKIAWNFVLQPQAGDGARTRVVTTTRIRCTDEISQRRFARYWRWVAPFSGWIRVRMLELVRADAERESASAR